MSSTSEVSNKTPATTATNTNENALDDLVSQLRQSINKSDWLANNTSAKWEADNPELAKQWREAVKTPSTDENL